MAKQFVVSDLPPPLLPRYVYAWVLGTVYAVGMICLGRWGVRRHLLRSLRAYLVEHGIPVCQHCGYLLRGLTEPRCPECGAPFDPALLERGSADE